MKTTMSKMKNILDRVNSKLDTTEESNSKLKIIAIGVIRNEIYK